MIVNWWLDDVEIVVRPCSDVKNIILSSILHVAFAIINWIYFLFLSFTFHLLPRYFFSRLMHFMWHECYRCIEAVAVWPGRIIPAIADQTIAEITQKQIAIAIAATIPWY